MRVTNFKSYIEGVDIAKIPMDFLAYPSSDVLVYKGKVVTRGGTEIVGAVSDADNGTHGFTWKDAKGGERSMRGTGTSLQVYYSGAWHTIYSSLNDADVDWCSWIDSVTTPAIIKKRLVMVDGSVNFIHWNGAIGVVKTVDDGADTIEVEGSISLVGLGFEDGSSTAEDILIGGVTYNRNDTGSTTTMSLTGSPDLSGVSVGDLVFSKPQTNDGGLTTFNKDLVYSYKNHIAVAGYDTVEIYFSHAETLLDYTIPAPVSRTAITAFVLLLDGKTTAMIERKDKLWISTIDDWFKITKLNEKNAYDLFVEVEKIDSSERQGAMPRAVTNLKGDTLFVSQNSTIERITDQEIIQVDRFQLMSDDIEGTLLRFNLTGVRIKYFNRYILVTVPAESKLIMYDNVESGYQPPMNMAVSSVNVADGELIGHSTTRNESFKMFVGHRDLADPSDATSGIPVEGVIAFGYSSDNHEFYGKKFSTIGLSGRLTSTTKVAVESQYEESASKMEQNFEFVGKNIKTYKLASDASWASYPFATRSWAGASLDESDLERFIIFNKFTAITYIEFRPIIRITAEEGGDANFQLIGIHTNRSASDRKIEKDLFVAK